MKHRPATMIRQWIEREKLKNEQQEYGFEGTEA